jgi:hypothetical protein
MPARSASSSHDRLSLSRRRRSTRRRGAAGRRACVMAAPSKGWCGAERATSRAAGRRARRSTGQATGGRASKRPVGLSPPFRRRGRAPSDRRWPYRLRFVGVGAALRARSSPAARPRSRDPRARLWLRSPRHDRSAPPGDPRHSRLGNSGEIPASPSAPLLRCPVAVSRCAVPLAARSQPRPAPSPVAADPSPAIGIACDASVRRPLAARLPAARDGAASAGHLPPTKARNAAGPWGRRQGEIEESW